MFWDGTVELFQMRKVCAVALPMVCLVLASCSRLKRSEMFDVTGCEEIKWGMTLTQAKDLLGSRAQIITKDPESGMSFLTVKMMIGDVELPGFVSTKPDSDRISGVHLNIQTAPVRDVKQEIFRKLKHILTKKYGPPLGEQPE